MKRSSLKIFGISLLISLLVCPLRSGDISIGPVSGFQLSSIVGFLIYFVLTVVSLNKTKNRISPLLVVLLIITGQQILTLPIRIMNFSGTLISLPESLIHASSVLLGYLFYKSAKIPKLLIGAISIIYCFYISVEGYKLWVHKLNFGTFTGKTEMAVSFDLNLVDEYNREISLKEIKGKYLIMDFWFSGCGRCFSEMPKVQSLYDELAKLPDVVSYTVNVKLKKDSDTFAFTRLKELGFSLPTLRTDMEDPALKQLGVNVFPTALIFDSNRNLVFRGNIDRAREEILGLINDTL